MPPRRYSRHTFCTAAVDETTGALMLSEPEPFGFQSLSDNVQHTVRDGDTLFGLAGTYFAPLARACGLWWIIADFQPTPIVDPTLKLAPGSTLWIPSLRTVTELVFSETRRG